VSDRKYTITAVGPRIDQFLRPLLDTAGFETTYEMSEGHAAEDDFETPDIVVKFNGRDVDLLLGNRAELLLALEHVTMEALSMPSEDHSRISFDANDYRLLRIEELRLSAAAAAEKVKHTGVPFRFNPMNSRERRVIHLALRNETELRSESGGTGAYRHVVVYPAGMASLPDPPQPAFAPREREPGRGFGPPRDRGPRDRDHGRDRDRAHGRPSRGPRR